MDLILSQLTRNAPAKVGPEDYIEMADSQGSCLVWGVASTNKTQSAITTGYQRIPKDVLCNLCIKRVQSASMSSKGSNTMECVLYGGNQSDSKCG